MTARFISPWPPHRTITRSKRCIATFASILANVEDILVELDEAEIPEPDMRAQAVLDAIEQRDENKAVRATLAILKPQMTY